ncbi:MAG: HU family DNA-binding protein [Micropruina sp.]
MNTQELVAAVAARTGLNRTAAENAVDAVLELIATEVSDGEKVTLPRFGVFEVRHRAARPGRNPRTGAPITVAERRVPVFRPSSTFRERVNERS